MSLQPINLSQGSGTPAVGTILSVSNLGSPQTFIPIGNASNIKWNLKMGQADTTNQGTGWKQSIPTLGDPGTMTCDIHFIPGSAGRDGLSTGLEGHSFSSGLGYIFQNRQIRYYTLTFPDGTAEVFQAYISEFPIDADVTKDLMLHVTFQLTGQPTFI